jgi:hypothetical protein
MAWAAVVFGVIGLVVTGLPRASAGLRRSVDPATVVPIDQLAPGYRDEVIEVIRDHHFHQQSKPDTFPSNPKLYLSLLNEPALTLALWKDLSPSPARLQQVRSGVYQGTDGAGTSATWEYALRSPKLHVLFSRLEYTGPRGNTRLEGRIVLVVRSGFYREVNGETWVQHDIEAFVKVDSRGWRTVAATARPIIERLLDDQVQEAGWFVSIMARMVEMYPAWAVSVAMRQADVPAESREGFRTLVAQTRRPGAREGRPQLADATPSAAPAPATASAAGASTRRY